MLPRMLMMCFLFLFVGLLQISAGEPPPNILLIVSDDQGYAEMSCQGGDIPTPNLDSLAKNGVRCTAGYVTAPYCSPSRAGMITGRYQQRFGHEGNPVESRNDKPGVGLPVKEKTIADLLKSAGLATGMTGKWHLGVHPEFHPLKRGFDEFFGFLREGHFYLPEPYTGAHVVSHLRKREPDYDRLNPILRGTEEVAEKEYLSRAFGREAAAFIEKHKAQSWFLYLPFNAPHSPMQALPEDCASFPNITDPQRKTWAGMMKGMDDAIGVVLEKLKQSGLEERTLIFFVSDHGGPTKELTSRNDPFSGGKGSLREGGVRVPLLIQWKGHLPAGSVYDHPVSTLDILPTAMAAVGAKIPDGLKLDGVNLLPYLRGENKNLPHETLYFRLGKQIALRHQNWKLLREQTGAPFQLYDLSSDAAESKNLANENAAQVEALKEKLMKWNAELIEPLF